MGSTRGSTWACAALVALAACDSTDDPAAPTDITVSVAIQGLPALDTITAGPFELWVVGADGTVASASRFEGAAAGAVTGTVAIEEPVAVMVTLEPLPDSTPGAPSELRILGGAVADGQAVLDVVGYLTPNLPFETSPGSHVLGTFGDGTQTSPDDAGVWLHNPGTLADTLDGSYFLDLTPLTAGWNYEGWVVADMGSVAEVWISYGKFGPDDRRQLSMRDDTGLGPFSGALDYERALPFLAIVPGDDWLSNPLDAPVPGGLPLPLDLNGCDGATCLDAWRGPSRFTHVVTIEPYNDRWEEAWSAQPFFLRPYSNAIGEAAPGEGRALGYSSATFPTGSATLNR